MRLNLVAADAKTLLSGLFAGRTFLLFFVITGAIATGAPAGAPEASSREQDAQRHEEHDRAENQKGEKKGFHRRDLNSVG